MGIGWQIVWSAFPAFLLGHGALMLLMADNVKNRLVFWNGLMIAGYGVCGLCLIVGALVVIWS